MKTTPHQASGLALDFIIKHAQTNPGTMNAIADRLTKMSGQKVYRQYIGQWLCPDPAKRVQPDLGMGLLLIQAGKEQIHAITGKMPLLFLPMLRQPVLKKRATTCYRPRKSARKMKK